MVRKIVAAAAASSSSVLMAKENEPAKLLLPYVQLADELQKHEPLVAYYCNIHSLFRCLFLLFIYF